LTLTTHWHRLCLEHSTQGMVWQRPDLEDASSADTCFEEVNTQQ